MNTITAAKARAKLAELIAEANASHDPVLITSKKGNAILVSEDDWRSIVETVHLMSMPGLADDIKEGMNTPVEECSEEPGW